MLSSLDEYFFTARRSYASASLGVVILSVRPSVCPSHACFVTNPKNLPAMFLYQMKGQSFYSFLMLKISAKFQRVHPDGGAKQRWGRLKRRFSTNIWLYLTNGAKKRHTYYGTLIETRMCSIDWCYFQWHWGTLTTPTPIFDISYRLSYLRSERSYRLRIL